MSTSSASSTLLQLSRKAAAIRAAELPRFQALFPKLVRQLTEPNCEATDQTSSSSSSIIEHSLFREKTNSSSSSSEIDHAHRWLSSMLQYNVPHGKLARGLALSINYQILQYGYEAVEQGTPETLLQSSEKDLTGARVLGWCVELFQAYFLVLDDIMDGSITRRGQPCWYRKENVGLIALNDSTLMEASIFSLMHRYLREHPFYEQLVHLMHEGFRITGYGQSLDMITEAESGTAASPRNLAAYRLERYQAIVQYKTAFYTFVLSARLALYLAGRADRAEHRTVEALMLQIGELFQVQDDYLDCFADPAVIGKIGTDIRDGKCSWLVVTALQRATTEQRAVIQANYGRGEDAQAEAAIKALYREMNLAEVYREYERQALADILRQIEQLKEKKEEECGSSSSKRRFPVEIFYEPLSHVYGREK